MNIQSRFIERIVDRMSEKRFLWIEKWAMATLAENAISPRIKEPSSPSTIPAKIRNPKMRILLISAL
jgi:hypothetical protein